MNRTVLTLRVCGWSSIGMGLVFFLVPGWYAELEGATTDNIAWLRNLGAALVAVNGVGALLAAQDPEAERRLYDVVMLASVLETIALAWSTLTWEFTAARTGRVGECRFGRRSSAPSVTGGHNTDSYPNATRSLHGRRPASSVVRPPHDPHAR
jgi:hypothetical protein